MRRKKDSIRGDKLRDLIFLVHLNDRFGFGKKISVSKVKQYLGYSAGGVYNALDESGYLIRKGDDIFLSDQGKEYVRKELMQPYHVLHPIGYFFVFFGIILIAHWYLLTYHNFLLYFDWITGASFIIMGLFLRFALLPFLYWYKLREKV